MTVYEIITDQIVKSLEAGVVPWRQPWHNVANGGMPLNARGKRYRGINVMLLLMEKMVKGYQSNYWLTYNQAQAMGGTVKKGEKSTIVTFWKVGEPVQEWDEDAQRTVTRRPFILRYYRVFNLDQTEGVKLTRAMKAESESIALPHSTVTIDEAEAIVASYFVRDDAPKMQPDGGNRAFYVPALDFIKVPDRTQYDNPAEYYSTLFHEMTHSTGHPARCNRPQAALSHDRESYGKEELVAEMGSAFLSAEASIGNETIDNSAAYIASWLRTIRGDNRLVVNAASAAQKALDYIMGIEYNDDTNTEEGE